MNVPEGFNQSAMSEILGYSQLQMASANNQQQKSDIEALVNSRMMSVLTEENKSLRSQCDSYIRKTYKLQQVFYFFLHLCIVFLFCFFSCS